MPHTSNRAWSAADMVAVYADMSTGTCDAAHMLAGPAVSSMCISAISAIRTSSARASAPPWVSVWAPDEEPSYVWLTKLVQGAELCLVA